jgi:hypothetical protein
MISKHFIKRFWKKEWETMFLTDHSKFNKNKFYGRITNLLLLTAMVLFGLAAISIHPVAASGMIAPLGDTQGPPEGCNVLPYCDYLRAHSTPGQGAAVSSSIAESQPVNCEMLSICDYLRAHSTNGGEIVISIPLIPVTNVRAPLINCQVLSNCGYLQMHAATGFTAGTQDIAGPAQLPDCQSQPICDYLQAHSR